MASLALLVHTEHVAAEGQGGAAAFPAVCPPCCSTLMVGSGVAQRAGLGTALRAASISQHPRCPGMCLLSAQCLQVELMLRHQAFHLTWCSTSSGCCCLVSLPPAEMLAGNAGERCSQCWEQWPHRAAGPWLGVCSRTPVWELVSRQHHSCTFLLWSTLKFSRNLQSCSADWAGSAAPSLTPWCRRQSPGCSILSCSSD